MVRTARYPWTFMIAGDVAEGVFSERVMSEAEYEERILQSGFSQKGETKRAENGWTTGSLRNVPKIVRTQLGVMLADA